MWKNQISFIRIGSVFHILYKNYIENLISVFDANFKTLTQINEKNKNKILYNFLYEINL